MRTIFESSEIPTPLDWDFDLLGRFLHGRSDLVVQRPRPVNLIVNPRTKVHGFGKPIGTRDVPGVHGLAGPGLHQCTLALGIADTFENGEVDRGDLDGPLDNFHEVWVDPLKTHL